MSGRKRRNKVGIKPPKPTKQIAKILDRYRDGGQILKELVQNADDAGATEVKFRLDRRQHSTDDLLAPGLSQFQGPALYAWNNACFDEADWEHIGKMYDSGKEKEPLKVGRFGLGFLSVFHMTDLPIIISNDTVGILDPHRYVHSDDGEEALGLDRDLSEFLTFASHAECFDGLFGLDRQTEYYNGTLFRFPLRCPGSRSEISPDPYPCERVEEMLFSSFFKEAPIIMLFVKHIKKMTLYDGDSVVHQVEMHPSLQTAMVRERRILDDLASNAVRGNTSALRAYSASFVVESCGKVQVYNWLIMNMIGSQNPEVCGRSKELNLLPWVGVAAPLPDVLEVSDMVLHDSMLSDPGRVFNFFKSRLSPLPLTWSGSAPNLIQGQAFCFLPLPCRTFLPVNIHGYFAIDDNRRSIKWPNYDDQSSQALWNKTLLLELAAPMYSILLAFRCCLLSYRKTPLPYQSSEGSTMTDPYAAWPLLSEVKNEQIWGELLKPAVSGALTAPVFWSAARGGMWVSISEAYFLPESVFGHAAIPDIAVEVLVEAGYPVVSLPQPIRETLQSCKQHSILREHTVSSVLALQAFSKLPHTSRVFFRVTTEWQSLHQFLEYAFDGVDFHSSSCIALLRGLKLLPLSTSQLSTCCFLQHIHASQLVYLMPDSLRREKVVKFLPGIENRLVDLNLPHSVFLKMELLAKKGIFQLRLVTPTVICQTLIPESLSCFNWARNSTVSWSPGQPNQPELSLISSLWKWLCTKDGGLLYELCGLPILPQELVPCSGHVPTITLHPFPSTRCKYFMVKSGGSRLSGLAKKCGAEIVQYNQFVFNHPMIDSYVIKLTIPSLLEFIGRNPSLVSKCLDDEEKAFFRGEIARFYHKSQFCNLLHEVLVRLPIYEMGVGASSSQLVALKQYPFQSEWNGILPQASFIFDDSLYYPSNILSNDDPDVVKLIHNLGLSCLSSDVLMCDHILPFALKQCHRSSTWCNGDKLILWMLKTRYVSSDMPNRLKTTEFMRTSANMSLFKKPCDLYDPSSDEFRQLFSQSDPVFPHNQYREQGVDHFLRGSGGIITWQMLVQNEYQMAEFFLSRASSVKDLMARDRRSAQERSCAILRHIVASKHRSSLLSRLSSSKFLLAETSPDASSYPSVLAWYGSRSERQLYSFLEICSSVHQNLIGSVRPIFSKEQEAVFPFWQHFLKPHVNDVVQHLGNLVVCVEGRFLSDSDLLKIEDMVHAVYRFLDDCFNTSVLQALPKKWIWHGNCFLAADKFALRPPVELAPFFYSIRSTAKLSHYKNLFCKWSISESVSTVQMQNILQQMKRKEPLSDSEVKMAIDILHYFHKTNTHTQGVLVPTETHTLRLAKDCTFDDREWVRQKYGKDTKKFTLIHHQVTATLARYAGVIPFSQRVAPSQKLQIRYSQTGQKESLIRRIRGIVQDYSGNIDVFKELIQNADDAKATEVKLLVDWRTHRSESLLSDSAGLHYWQGPALLAYNNASFSDQDFDNICEIAAETKRKDPLKTGRFGIGFCSCYHLTDLPSFVSRRFITIFDPHTKYLGDRVSYSEPGMRINLVEEQEDLEIYEDQFSPYNGIFGCNIFKLGEEGYQGTLFRLPFRKDGYPHSEIAPGITHNRFSVNTLLKQLEREGATLLLFLKHIQSLEVYVLEEKAASADKMSLVFKVKKNMKESKERMDLLKNYGTAPAVSPSPPLAHCCHRSSILVESAGKTFRSDFVMSSAIRVPQDTTIPTGFIPLTEIAIEVSFSKDKLLSPVSLKNGKLFCFLPLPLQSHLPYHVNGYFDIGKDRRGLTEADGSDGYLWNKGLIEGGLPVALEHLLSYLAARSDMDWKYEEEKRCFLKELYLLWSDGSAMESVLGHGAGKGWISGVACEAIAAHLPLSCKNILWSEVGSGEWVSPKEACLFSPKHSMPSERREEAIQVMLSRDYQVINHLPTGVFKILREPVRKLNHLYDYQRFFRDIFLPNLASLDRSMRDNQLLYVLVEFASVQPNHYAADYFTWVRDALKGCKCIPVLTLDTLEKPVRLIDTTCKLTAQLFSPEEGRFPAEAFVRNANAKTALKKLGMVSSLLPIDELIERAQSVAALVESDGIKRMENLLQYLLDTYGRTSYTYLPFLPLEAVSVAAEAIKDIPFLTTFTSPCELSMPWLMQEEPFVSPSQTYSSTKWQLVFTQKPVAHFRALEDDSLRLVRLLHIDKNVPTVELVLDNLCCVVDHIVPMGDPVDESTAAYLDKECIFSTMYSHLDQRIKEPDSHYKESIVNRLKDVRCMWQDGHLLSATQVVFHWKGKGLFPYLCELSTANKEYRTLFDSLGVQQEASIELLFETLQRVESDYHEVPLEEKVLDFVAELVQQLAILVKSKGQECMPKNMLLPDVNAILHQASSMSCDSNLQGWDSEMLEEFRTDGGHFVHESIQRTSAMELGARPLLEAFLREFEDNKFLDGTDFGQQEKLVDRLNSILRKYPNDSTIFREFIQNADDAKATDVVFILDHRTSFPDANLLSDSESHNWKKLQHTPSLLILNNRCFSERDFKGICRLGSGGKRDSDDTIGRFGIGFNAAYHLTDCPSFISFEGINKPTDFCVFDPLRKYCPKSRGRKPGRRWKISPKHLNQFTDQFSPFLMDLMEDIQSLAPNCLQDLSQGYVVFRMPLTRWRPSYYSLEYLHEGRASDIGVVKDLLLRDFKKDMKNMLLFLNNVRHISVFEIPQKPTEVNLPLLHHFTSTFTNVVGQTNLGIAQAVTSPQSILCRVIMNYAETKWKGSLTASATTATKSQWLICKRCGTMKGSLEAEASRRCLKPLGGTAAPTAIEGSPVQGCLFCYLPMPIPSELPVHINGHFLVDDSRKHLDTLTGLEEWNTTLARDIVTPSYIDLLVHAREYVDETTASIKWFYSLFPDLTSIADSQSEVSKLQVKQSFYRQLLDNNAAVLLDARGNHSQNNWLTPTGKSVGYFCIEHSNITPQRNLPAVLVLLGMPITLAPAYIFKSLCMVSDVYASGGHLTPDKVILHLRSLMPLDRKHAALIKDSCELLLTFCLQHCHDVRKALMGTPILLSVDNTLECTGQLFVSTFSRLLPHCGQNFIHPSIERYQVSRKLLEAGIIVCLPLSFVASKLQLPRGVTSYIPTEREKTVIQILWNYLDTIHGLKSEEIKESLFSFPILPTSQGTFFPPSHGKCVFTQDKMYMNALQVMMKLGYSQIDFSVIGSSRNPNLTSILSSPHCASDIIRCLQLQEVKSYSVHLDEREASQIVFILSQVSSDIPREVASVLKRLPLFKLVDGSYVALSSGDDFCILPERVPTNGLSTFHKATRKLVLKGPSLAEEKLYKSVIGEVKYEKAKLSDTEFYFVFIVHNVAHLSDADLLQHLQFVYYSSWNKNDVWRHVLDELKGAKLVTCKDESRHEASKFFDPEEEFFSVFYRQKLPPPEWWKSQDAHEQWRIRFLRMVGLQCKFTPQQWLVKAKKFAQDVKTPPKDDEQLEDVRKKSRTLLHSLNLLIQGPQHELAVQKGATISPSFQEFLHEASKLPFIFSSGKNKTEKLLQTFTHRNPTNASKFIRFQNSVFHNHAELAGLERSVLPVALKKHTYHRDVVTILGIIEPLPVKTVVKDLITLTEALACPQASIVRYSPQTAEVIHELRNILEAHYAFLNEHADERSVSELLKRRCILVSSDHNSIFLVKPSQVILQLPAEADYRPFCYRALPELLKHDRLREILHIQQDLQPYQFLEILTNIKEEMERLHKELSSETQYSMVCKCAYEGLVESLRNCRDVPELPNKIFLPSTELQLISNSELVYNDTPWIASRLEKASTHRYKFLLSPPPNKQDLRTPPACLKVKHLSTLAVEKLHSDVHSRVNQCLEEDLYKGKSRVTRCLLVEKLLVAFKSKELSVGFGRLYWHEWKKNPRMDKPFMKKLLALKAMEIHCVNILKTVIELEGKNVSGTENDEHLCHLDTQQQQPLKLYITHHACHFHEEVFLEQLAAGLTHYLNNAVKNGMAVKAMLRCKSPAEIDVTLDHLRISPFDPRSSQDMDHAIQVGEELPQFEECLQVEDLLMFCNFSAGDDIVYHCAKTGKYLYAKVKESKFKGHSIFERCLTIQVNADNDNPKIVSASLLQVYKSLNSSQRTSLKGQSAVFANPLTLAQTPETKQELKQWLVSVFRSDVIQSCTSCSKLISQTSLRLVAHLHYLLVTMDFGGELFLPVMKKLIKILSEEDLPSSSTDDGDDKIFEDVKALVCQLKGSSIQDSECCLQRESSPPSDRTLADILSSSLQSSGSSSRQDSQSPYLATSSHPSPSSVHPLHPSISSFQSASSGLSSVFSAYHAQTPQGSYTSASATPQQPPARQRRTLPPSVQLPVFPQVGATRREEPPNINFKNAKAWLQQAKADYLAASKLYSVASSDVDARGFATEDSNDEQESGGELPAAECQDIEQESGDDFTGAEERDIGQDNSDEFSSTVDVVNQDYAVGESCEDLDLAEKEEAEDENGSPMLVEIDDVNGESDEEMVQSKPPTIKTSKHQYSSHVCFLAHDSIEKCMKGVMYAKCGLPTHLLDCRQMPTLAKYLQDSCRCPKAISKIVKECVMQVVEHAEKSRYPNYNIPPCAPASCYSSQDAIQALSSAKRLMDAVISEPDFKELIGELDELPETQFVSSLVQTRPGEDFPEFWADQDGDFQLVTLDPDSDEYHRIAAMFLQTLPQKDIVRIERIQNRPLWRRYIDCYKRMVEFNKNVINEKTLFHGTRLTSPEAIYKGSRSFDMTFSNDGMWGRGNYFAVNASYSLGYAHHKGGYRFMLVANVLTGFAYYSKPDRFIKQPPIRHSADDGEGQICHNYDCVTGVTGGSKVYITYDNEKAYPAYLITFK